MYMDRPFPVIGGIRRIKWQIDLYLIISTPVFQGLSLGPKHITVFCGHFPVEERPSDEALPEVGEVDAEVVLKAPSL